MRKIKTKIIRGIISIFFLSLTFSMSQAQTVSILRVHKTLVTKTSKNRVWKALTNEKELEKWWGKGVRLEPHPGGEFYEPWGDGQLATGKVLEVKKNDFIKFTWKEKYFQGSEQTTCNFFLSEKDGITTLEVNHHGWESFSDLEQRLKLIKGFEKGWDLLLERLKKYFDEQNKVRSK